MHNLQRNTYFKIVCYICEVTIPAHLRYDEYFLYNKWQCYNVWQYLCLFPKYPDIWRYIRSMKNIWFPKNKLMLMLFKETSRLIKEQTWHISSLVNKITWPCRDVWYTKMLIFCSQINIINVPCHCSIMKCIIKFISSFLYLWIQNLFLLIDDNKEDWLFNQKRVIINWMESKLNLTFKSKFVLTYLRQEKLVNARMRCNSITKNYISHRNVTSKGFTAVNFVGF